MTTVTYKVCDECGRSPRNSVELDGHIYCSRDCYLAYSKRVFDRRWLEELSGHSKQEKAAANEISPVKITKRA